ncbi:MAG: 50S ribosome-binding GTPase [Rubellimicrobium sp.]|nr:50S ribosome-binding GTPase [Rubellimicrobium sp.]
MKTTVPEPSGPRRPRLALMGEFSAGKSTLANLLAGTDRLPVQVTATELPPVWLSATASGVTCVRLDGREVALEDDRLANVDLARTAYVRVGLGSGLLDRADLIDMPGISDPNMPPEVWQRLLPEADAILWCTHATQAWRQSEAAVWDMVPEAIRRRSLLVVTRIDKILRPEDRARLLRRLAAETDGAFAAPAIPVALTRAIAGRGDPAIWSESGADRLMAAIGSVLSSIGQGVVGSDEAGAPARLATGSPVAAGPASSAVAAAQAVVPRRIKLGGAGAGPAGSRATARLDPAQSADFRAAIGEREG